MIRFQIVLTTDEADALFKLSESNLRSPRDQVHYLIRKELVRIKLLTDKEMDETIRMQEKEIVDEK